MIEENEFYGSSVINYKIATCSSSSHGKSPKTCFSPRWVSNPSFDCLDETRSEMENCAEAVEKRSYNTPKPKTKFSEQHLSLFSQRYNELVSEIQNIKTPKANKRKTVSRPSFNSVWKQIVTKTPNLIGTKTDYLCLDSDEFYLQLTNTERITDFYEYTEECMHKMVDLTQNKPNVLNKVNVGGSHKFLALIDLDETLVHCTGKATDKNNSQHIVEVKLPLGKKVRIGINIRPQLKESLDIIKQYYTLVLYTASHQSYTDAVLNLIDPDREYFQYRLYRNNCIPTKIDGKDFFIKDLSIIDDYPMENIVIVDNSVLSFAYHINNGIPIVPYYEGDEDSELPILACYLLSIRQYNDLREANKNYIKLDSFVTEEKKDILLENKWKKSHHLSVKEIN